MSWQIIVSLWAGFLFFELITSRKKSAYQGIQQVSIDFIFVAVNAFLFWEYWPALDQLIQKHFEIPQISLWGLPLFWQFLCIMVIRDFFMWWTHRSLHTFSILWKIHKTHHRITELYFLRVLRYNPLENIIYAVTTLPVLLLFSFDSQIWIYLFIFEACIGYMNHSNTRLRVPVFFAKIINTPQVHIWHHDESHPKRSAKNFGINLSLWDFLFGTLFLSDKDPKEIGYKKYLKN